MDVDQGLDRGTCPSPMFGGEGGTISNVPLTNWSKFIFYLVENCHSHVLLTIFKHVKHQKHAFTTTKLYTIFDYFTLLSAPLLSFLHFILTVIANFADDAKF